jgi:hypothetical protein
MVATTLAVPGSAQDSVVEPQRLVAKLLRTYDAFDANQGGKLYAAHSNYNESPMVSSIEIFDARTMEQVGTHSFGIERGSLTWLDRHDGAWGAAFANYDRVFDGEVYRETNNTQVVQMDDDFDIVAS